MSFGSLSSRAIASLNKGVKLANAYHNTGEGGVSRFHRQGGGDIVWNVGTGYFGCGSGSGSDRRFDPTVFKESIDAADGRIKMIEIKLSQGAKPGHGGLLPRAKITREIAETRKLQYPALEDCHSPSRHSAFNNPHEMIEFIASVREHSGGLPVGIKFCVGEPGDVAALCKAMVDVGNGPDFITVDGAEGGTGAAPPELSNSVGLPLEEGLVLVRNMLTGADLKEKTAIIASGKVSSALSLVKTIALGADVCAAARAFMISLGCIQSLKCNLNTCPTGVATLNKDLMDGLDPELKSTRGEFFPGDG
jgi:glutamate synthase domain-containing protein 2